MHSQYLLSNNEIVTLDTSFKLHDAQSVIQTN